jgi:hypothetical protein
MADQVVNGGGTDGSCDRFRDKAELSVEASLCADAPDDVFKCYQEAADPKSKFESDGCSKKLDGYLGLAR